jgi:putative membrane protein
MNETKSIAITFVVLAAIAAIGAAALGTVMGGAMGPGMMWGYGAAPAAGWPWGLAMALGWIAMLAFWGALVFGVILLVRWVVGSAAGPTAGAPKSDEPLVILKRRYATGEIDRETYEQMSRDLGA